MTSFFSVEKINVSVKRCELTRFRIPWGWEIDYEVLHLFVFNNSDVVLNELKGLHGLNEVLLVEVLLGVVILLWDFGDHIIQWVSLWLCWGEIGRSLLEGLASVAEQEGIPLCRFHLDLTILLRLVAGFV
jgi:hypothetical protein